MLGKYVGETEQNIAQAFEEASQEDKLLIFDEADSLIGSRGNAQRSWEISQVNEFLTQMEKHDKPFICTTNLMTGCDEAVFRRFTFKVRMDFLRREQVLNAFEKYFKQPAPKHLLDCEILSLGDFFVVKKKADIMNITDVNELARMLLQEVEIKPQFRRKMGF